MSGHDHPATTRFRYRLSPVRVSGLIVIIAIGTLLLLPSLYFLVPDGSESASEVVPTSMLWVMIAAGAGVALLIGFYRRQASQAVLVSDHRGIRCRPPVHHGQRVWTRHEWRLEWEEIDRVVIYRPSGNARHLQSWMMTTLVMQAGSREYRTGLLHWDPEEGELDRPHATSWGMGDLFHPLTENHPLIRTMREQGIAVDYQPLDYRALRRMKRGARRQRAEAESHGYIDLFAYPSLVLMLGLVGLLAVAAIAHFVVLPPLQPLWVSGYGVAAAIAAGVFVAAVLAVQRIGRRVPAREAVVVALLLSVGIGLSWNPLSLRFDVLVNGERETVLYRYAGEAVFEPVETAYPVVELENLDVAEYFESLENGSRHEFVLIRTGPGRFVLSLREFFEKTRAFYSAADAGS